MKPHFKLKFSNILLKWIFTYILILMIPILISSFYCLHTYQLIKEGNQEQEELALEKSVSMLDNSFMELMHISNSYQLDNYIAMFAYATPDSSNFSRQVYVSNIQKNCSTSKAANNLIQNINLYFPNIETVINRNNIYNTDLTDYMSGDFIHRDTWHTYMKMLSQTKHMLLLEGNSDQELVAIRTIVSDSSRNPLCIIAFQLNKEILLKQLTTNTTGDILLCTDNTFLLSSNPDLMRQDFSDLLAELSQFQGNNLSAYIPEAAPSYIVNTLPLTSLNLTCISLTETRLYRQTQHEILFLLIVTFSVCILLGFLLTIYIAKRNYAPIRQILRYIKQDEESSSTPNPSQNEYELIIGKLRSNSAEIRKQQELIKNDYFHKLLTGEISYQSLTVISSQQFDLVFPDSPFIIAVIPLKTVNSFILTNVLNELLLVLPIQVHFCQTQNSITAVLHYQQKEDYQEKALVEQLRLLVAFCEKYYHFPLTIGLSNLFETNAQMANAYMQANEVIEYSYLFQKQEIISYAECVKSTNYETSVLYDADALIHIILNGNGNVDELDAYFAKVDFRIQSNSFSMRESKDFLYFIYRVSQRLKLRLTQQYGSNYPKEIDLFTRELFDISFQDAFSTIQDLFYALLHVIDSYKENDHQQYFDKICDYMNNNYFNANLNLNSIAKHFQITPHYLSNRFKENQGISVIDYLYGVRIEHSETLLKTTDLKITEIATMVGFLDSNAFIRIFKKIKGITPGKYKNAFTELTSIS